MFSCCRPCFFLLGFSGGYGGLRWGICVQRGQASGGGLAPLGRLSFPQCPCPASVTVRGSSPGLMSPDMRLELPEQGAL